MIRLIFTILLFRLHSSCSSNQDIPSIYNIVSSNEDDSDDSFNSRKILNSKIYGKSLTDKEKKK
jgi:hypothetical protein